MATTKAAKKKTRRDGTPPPEPVRRKPDERRKAEDIHIRATVEQKATLAAAAEREGMGVSTWLLSCGLRAARQEGAT